MATINGWVGLDGAGVAARAIYAPDSLPGGHSNICRHPHPRVPLITGKRGLVAHQTTGVPISFNGHGGNGGSFGATYTYDAYKTLSSPFAVNMTWVGRFSSMTKGTQQAMFGNAAGNVLDQLASSRNIQGAGAQWWEHVHANPLSFNFGNVVAAQEFTLEIYNAYRTRPYVVLNDFDSTAGAGVDITGLPPTPANLASQNSISLTLNVSVAGPPTISGDFIFDFDVIDFTIPLVGSRVLLIPYVPEAGVVERWAFKTDIIKALLGTEQRIGLRKFPRRTFKFRYKLRTPKDITSLQSLLTGWQGRAFGVPHWWEERKVTAAVTAGALTVPVQTTANADFFAGGLAMVYTVDATGLLISDVLEIESLDATSITFTSPVGNSYEAGTARCMPVVAGFTQPRVGMNTPASGDCAEFEIEFDTNLKPAATADFSAFASLNSKPVVVDENIIEGALSEEWRREMQDVDFELGLFARYTDELRSVRASTMTWWAQDQTTLYNIRKLLLYLKGRQRSFYLSTHRKDLVLTQTVANNSNSFTVQNARIAEFDDGANPRSAVRFVLTNGVTIVRALTGSQVAGDEETLTISGTFPQTINLSDVVRIEWMELVRLDDDVVTFNHMWSDELGAIADTTIEAPVTGVLE